LGLLEPGFLAETSAHERRTLVTMFAGAAAAITVEVDVDDILTRGADRGQDGVYV
jgi:hypothetical protein